MYKCVTRVYYDSFSCEFLQQPILNDHNIYHHLVTVLRIKRGKYISIFHADYGEYLALITQINPQQRIINLELIKQLKAPYQEEFYYFTMYYAPLKKHAQDVLIEKNCELGIHKLCSINTDYTVNKPLAYDKIHYKTVLATQQCERLNIPQIAHLEHLKNLTQQSAEIIFWLNEDQQSPSLTQLSSLYKQQRKISFLIGPEGGFSTKEKHYLSQQDNIIPVSLAGNILRAETASLTSLIIFKTINCIF